jgi:Leucine-rich repeat (LRR) protein
LHSIYKYSSPEEPEETQQHYHLKYLDVSGNYLTDDIFDEFAELFENYNLLEYLGLGDNNLSDLVSKIP